MGSLPSRNVDEEEESSEEVLFGIETENVKTFTIILQRSFSNSIQPLELPFQLPPQS